MTLEQTLVPFDKDQAKQFCGLCLASGYTQSWVDQRLGLLVPPPANRVSIELAASLDQEPRPVNLLGKLFFLGMPIDRTPALRRHLIRSTTSATTSRWNSMIS